MLIYLILSLTLLLAAGSLWLYGRARHWPARLLALFLGCFIFFYGSWVFLSIYLRYVFALVFLIVALSRRRLRPGRSGSWSLWLHSLGAFCFGLLVVLYFTGSAPVGKGRYLNLSFPFKQGNYLVFQGGRGLPANLFHVSTRGSVFAIDLVQLNRFGNRASAVFSPDLSRYETFGDTVYAPVGGVVQRAEGSNPDNTPPHRIRGPHNLNAVLIENDSCYVFLGHFKKGSLLVAAGDTVTTGTPLALAGNSGMSLEPHLHLQAHLKSDPRLPWYREPPLFILFDGKAYLLNEIIHAP